MVLWAGIMLFPRGVCGHFHPGCGAAGFHRPRAAHLLRRCLFLFGIQIACQMTFVSIGNALCSILVAVLRKFVLLLPLIFLLPSLLPDKVTAVYLAEPVADVIAVTCTALLFSRQFKKALAVLEGGK